MIFLWYLALSDLLQAVSYSSSKKKNKEINTATNPPEWLNIKKTKKKIKCQWGRRELGSLIHCWGGEVQTDRTTLEDNLLHH